PAAFRMDRCATPPRGGKCEGAQPRYALPTSCSQNVLYRRGDGSAFRNPQFCTAAVESQLARAPSGTGIRAERQGSRPSEANRTLRNRAEKPGMNTPEPSKEKQKSLQQAAETTRPGLEELAKLLKEAAENLKNETHDQAQEPLDEAASKLESLQAKMDSQQ